MAKPRIGIPISELLAMHGKSVDNPTAAGTGPSLEQKIVHDESPEEDAQMAAKYINEVELEFKGEAEEILKSMNLSYLQVKAPGKAH